MKQEHTPEQSAILILNAIALHERQLGVSSLALILKGSNSKRVFNRKLNNSKLFGALFYHSIDVIEGFIRQLIEKVCNVFPYPCYLFFVNHAHLSCNSL